MSDVEFAVETPTAVVTFTSTGRAAQYLLDGGFANADREPHWHLRWCLDRMAAGESVDVGSAHVTCMLSA